jgi:hypothetical protein
MISEGKSAQNFGHDLKGFGKDEEVSKLKVWLR